MANPPKMLESVLRFLSMQEAQLLQVVGILPTSRAVLKGLECRADTPWSLKGLKNLSFDGSIDRLGRQRVGNFQVVSKSADNGLELPELLMESKPRSIKERVATRTASSSPPRKNAIWKGSSREGLGLSEPFFSLREVDSASRQRQQK